MHTETRRFDLRAFGLLPTPRRPRGPDPLAPVFAACELAAIAWVLWFGLARLPLLAGLAVLDATERAGRPR